MASKIAVIYYSATGNVHRLAEAVAAGAESTGAEVRLRQVVELAPADAIAQNPAWQAHYDATKDTVETASLDDLAWADGFAFGTPTRFGNPSAQLKQFLDQTGGLWFEGKLTDKAATSFTSAMNQHGGQESTILALNNVFYHWGCIVVPPGYTDDTVYAAGGKTPTAAPGEAARTARPPTTQRSPRHATRASASPRKQRSCAPLADPARVACAPRAQPRNGVLQARSYVCFVSYHMYDLDMKPITITIPTELNDAAAAEARRRGISKSQLIRLGLAAVLPASPLRPPDDPWYELAGFGTDGIDTSADEIDSVVYGS